MGIVNDILSIAGFGSPKRRKSKTATLNSVSRRLDKKLKENKLKSAIAAKKKRLAKLS